LKKEAVISSRHQKFEISGENIILKILFASGGFFKLCDELSVSII